MRSWQLEQWSARYMGDTTARVYGALLFLLEKKIPRCKEGINVEVKREDDEDEDEDDVRIRSAPIVTTVEVLDVLDPSLDLASAIGDQPADEDMMNGLTNGNHRHHKKVKVEASDDAALEVGSMRWRHARVELIDQHLGLLAEHQFHFCEKVGTRGKSEWQVDFESLVTSMQQMEVVNTVNIRFGSFATRVVRMMTTKGKLDERQIAGNVMVRHRDIRSTLTELYDAGLLEMQEVARENSRMATRSIYLWYFDHDACVQLLLTNTYKAQCRALQRMRVQREKARPVIDKAERLDVIGHEEEYLTASDKKNLKVWREQEEKLLTQLSRQDDLVGIMRDF